MFEFRVALKYLLPKKKALSTSIISLVSIFVITLVIWLVLIFLSVTAGIEKNWLKKLTSLNAPLRITPTEAYFSSYYYQIDSLADSSRYELKSIGEKMQAVSSDPYSKETDPELPFYFPKPDLFNDGKLKDPVKLAQGALDSVKKELSLAYQDYEISGAFLRLATVRQDPLLFTERTSFLSQMTYLLSFTGENPSLKELLLKPSVADINNLIRQMKVSGEEMKKDLPSHPFDTDEKELSAVFENIELKKVKTEPGYILASALLPNGKWKAVDIGHNRIYLSQGTLPEEGVHGMLVKEKDSLTFTEPNGNSWKVSDTTTLILCDPLIWDVLGKKEMELQLETKWGETVLSGIAPFSGMEILDAEAKTDFSTPPKNSPLWAYFSLNKGMLPNIQGSYGVILPKQYRENGVLLGDKGYFSYMAAGGGASQEQRLSIYVAGFYDPGIMPVGNKCILVSHDLTRLISSASHTFSPDGTPTNGIYLWTKDIKEAGVLKKRLEKLFQEKEISPYFSISTYKEYEFSKELMQQFQSDRTLFTLIALVILFVACCNIISLLILLVNDKKKEIAILVSMGAKRGSIAGIFGAIGVVMGSLSCLFGTLAAVATLTHLDVLVSLLSKIQGHAAFQTAFFGDSLPNELSRSALYFVLIATPILSLIAGLIPALRASRLHASQILRSE